MKGDDMDQMEYDPDEGRESDCLTCENDDPCRDHPHIPGVCGSCTVGDHDDCGIILAATGTCRCVACGFKEPTIEADKEPT